MPVTTSQILLTFFGNVPSKKNNKRVLRRGKRTVILPSVAYCNWEKCEVARLKALHKSPKLVGYSLELSIYYPNNIERDEDNTLTSIKDCLQAAGMIKNDSWQNQSKPPVFNFVGIDRLNPRVEVLITY